ncbi:MAG TPA: hypothetical protein VLC92_12910 [Rhodocyclaceae bacterium]|nr:hypothetical protein [Rhodocyclaceae bacterium]
MLNWFSTKEVERFADDLASEFHRRFPAAEIAREDPQSESRLRGARDLMMSRTQVFSERHKLNIFKRAKLANTLKWKLRELNYDEKTTDSLVYEVVRIVTLIRTSR